MRPKARSLVKLLAVQPEHRLHEEQILDILWPDLDPDSASKSLAKALTYARHALEPNLPSRAPSSYLERSQGMVGLRAASVRIDVDDFEAQAQAALNGEEKATYERAVQTYTGELLPEDRYEDWTSVRREGLISLYLRLLDGLAEQLVGHLS